VAPDAKLSQARYIVDLMRDPRLLARVPSKLPAASRIGTFSQVYRLDLLPAKAKLTGPGADRENNGNRSV
jgi:hypothetical protein